MDQRQDEQQGEAKPYFDQQTGQTFPSYRAFLESLPPGQLQGLADDMKSLYWWWFDS